jgi:hypothetical protein
VAPDRPSLLRIRYHSIGVTVKPAAASVSKNRRERELGSSAPVGRSVPQEATFRAVHLQLSYAQLNASSMTYYCLVALITPNDHETRFAHHG